MDIEDLTTKHLECEIINTSNNNKKYEVISCSRRTDIPAFYMDTMIKCMIDKVIEVPNSYNKSQITKVSLDPVDVKVIAWWSKDYGKWIEEQLKNEELFSKYKHYFNFTITGGKALEQGVKTPLKQRLKQMKYLALKYTPQSIKLRFDPIVFYMEDNIEKNNLKHFERIIKYASKIGIKDVIFAFCISFPKVVRRMKNHGKTLVNLDIERKKQILDGLIDIVDKYGMTLKTCCSDELIGYKNKIKPNACIDGEIIENLLGYKLEANKKDPSQRKNCNCVVSKDIGNYSLKCNHSCEYCYANPSQ